MMPEIPTRPPGRLTVQVQNAPEEVIRDRNQLPTTSIPKAYPKDTVMEDLPAMPVRVYEPEAEDNVVMAKHMETDRYTPLSITDQGRPLSVEGGTRPKAILNQTKKKIQQYRAIFGPSKDLSFVYVAPSLAPPYIYLSCCCKFYDIASMPASGRLCCLSSLFTLMGALRRFYTSSGV